jgi:hypothetical protein
MSLVGDVSTLAAVLGCRVTWIDMISWRSSPWPNIVERWFGKLTTKLLQCGVRTSVHALEADIRAWIKTGMTTRNSYLDQDRRRTRSSTASADIVNESLTETLACLCPRCDSYSIPTKPPSS